MESVLRQGLTAVWSVSVLAVASTALSPILSALATYGVRRSLARPPAFELPLPKLSPLAGWTVLYTVAVLASASAAVVVARADTLSRTPITLALFLLQACRRLFETRFVHRHSAGEINPVVVVFGSAFYVAAALTLAVERSLAMKLATCSPARLAFSLSLFAAASLLQHDAHRALAAAPPLRGKYGVPRGGLFELVCCPHYTTEVAVYASLLCLCPGRLTLLMLTFVASNLAVSAGQTHAWYAKTFAPELLPIGRKAMLPFLY
jgi:hypothetical protein